MSFNTLFGPGLTLENEMKTLISLFKKSFSALGALFTFSVNAEEAVDVSRLAESLLPVSQLYGVEMSYLHLRATYDK